MYTDLGFSMPFLKSNWLNVDHRLDCCILTLPMHEFTKIPPKFSLPINMWVVQVEVT